MVCAKLNEITSNSNEFCSMMGYTVKETDCFTGNPAGMIAPLGGK
jgi:hypothetical protein